MKTVIKTEGLSKRFQIGRLRHDDATLRDLIGDLIRLPFSGRRRRAEETFWALSDVSFEVEQGETLGIVGRNGAGKSTLLKVLSRIIKPTRGRVLIEGRVNSLLEIGTGFHLDLTGRENIFLNAAVHGMKRREVKDNLDRIVHFAEIEKFLDSPVKMYSTGMQARLAFAVAAHIESDILIVDEVLAVGDAPFQAKCLERMESIAASGRTVLFVSHDAKSIMRLCKTGIYLEEGRVKQSGPMNDVVKAYYADINGELPSF